MEHMQAVLEVNVNNTQQDQGILLCVKQEYLFTSFVYNGYWSTINIAELDLHN